MPCSNAAKTQNPLKFVGVPQTPEPISAVSGPKFTILSGHIEEVLLLNKFFFRLSIRALVAKIWPDKFVRWCRDGDFWRFFCVLYLQRAACSAFQRGKKRRKKERRRNSMKIYMVSLFHRATINEKKKACNYKQQWNNKFSNCSSITLKKNFL